MNPCTFADTVGLRAKSSGDEGIKKVKQPGVLSELDTTLLLGYGTAENSMGGGMGGPNPSKT